MTQDTERLAEIESCPSCGALPCDWCNNPHASTLKPSERGPTTRQAVLTELDNNIRALAKGDV